MKYRIFFTLALFLLFSFFHFLLFIPSFAAEAEPPSKKIVARVNGAEITEEDLKEEIDAIIPKRTYHGTPLTKKEEQFKAQAVQNLILKEIVYQEAKSQKIQVKKSDVDKEIDKIKERLKTKNRDLKEVLKESGIPMKKLRERIEKELHISGLYEKVEKEFRAKAQEIVTERYLLDYYEKNKKKFVQPKRVRLREILFKIDPGGGKENWDKVKSRAEDILKRVKEGEDFAKLAKEYSEDEFAERGGDVGFVHRGSMMPEIEHVVEDLKEGEIGGPVWTLYGYHIIKLEEIAPPIQMTYEEVKERLKKSQEEKEYERLNSEWVDGLKKKAKIEILK